jgi:branched-chain amino acid transport system substrate-binding protein
MHSRTRIARRRILLGGAATIAAPAFLRNGLSAQPREIPVAIMQPLTGPVAFAGIPGRNGAEMACEAINRAGGIRSMGGAQLKPAYYDTESRPDTARLRAERAVQDGVAAIVGSPQSAVGRLISQVAERARIPNVVDMGSGDFLTESGFRYVFRVMPGNTQQTFSDLDFVQNVGQATGRPAVRRVAMLYEDTASGQEGFQSVRDLIGRHNMELVEGMGYPHAATDVTGLVSRLRRLQPEFLIMYSWEADSILFLRTMLEQNYTPPGIIGKSFSDKVIQETRQLSEFLFGTAFFSHRVDPPGAPRGRNQQFHDAYVARYGNFNPLAALTYTSVIVLANALERARSIDSQALRDALAATDMTGADGILQVVDRIKFDEKGSSIHARTLVDQIRGGERRIVFPTNIAEMRPEFPMSAFRSRAS